ncbi:MAG TPA: DUF5660 domain-containing protein [Candidatus Woesebacteria bacterium]|nr:DUF5660 domain-containing protein [Candidatus Woesebacteria bacterium]
MAGGNSFAKNPQNGKYNPAFDSAEIYKTPDSHQQVTVSSILNGVLRPGETIDFTQEVKVPEKPHFDNRLQREQSVFINEHQQDTQAEIQKIQQELQSLTENNQDLDPQTAKASQQNIPEANAYQLSFIQRIKKQIQFFLKDSSDSNSCIEISNNRRNKRFLSKAMGGGQKYRESSEHAVARSAN